MDRNKMRHYSFLDVISEMSEKDWGKSFASRKDAEKFMADNPQEMAANALLELIRLIRSVAREIAGKRRHWSEEPMPKDDRKEFHGVKVGDLLYGCDDFEGGVVTYIVVGVDGSYPIVVQERDASEEGAGSYTHYASSTYFSTAKEALRHMAEEDIEYHGKRFKYAERVLAAVESGEDLDAFYGEAEYDA